MKKYQLLVLLLFSLLFINSCGVLDGILGSGNNIGYDDGIFTYYDEYSSASKVFYVINEYTKVERKRFRVYAESDNLIVYIEDGKNVSRSSISQMGSIFHKNYADLVSIYGSHTDVDGNGKINILLFSMNPAGATTATLGYFYPGDLILGSFNDAEILYMDVDLMDRIPDVMSGTILHELQHLINYNVNLGKNIDLWLNESLSESTSILYSPETAQSRIEEFNNMGGYYCFYTWDLPLGIFANYPSASVFMNWLYRTSGNDKTVFRDIAKSTYNNSYDRVLSVASSRGIATTWDSLLLNWIDGLLNYQVTGISPKFRNPGENISLYPGALVAYYGSLGSSANNNLVTRKFNSNIEIALNKDTFVGESPTAINIQIPNSTVRNMNYSFASQKPYTPKYRNILFGTNGEIKKY